MKLRRSPQMQAALAPVGSLAIIKSVVENNMDFEGKKLEKEIRFDPNLEIGSFEDVKSSIVYCAISKKINNTWGNEQNTEISEYIKNQDINLDKDFIKLYQDVRIMAKENDETLGWLAFVAEKGTSEESLVVDQMIRHKGFDKKQAEILQSEFSRLYLQVKSVIDFGQIEQFISDDATKREKRLPEIKKIVNDAIDFFKPQPSQIKNVIYLPTNPLARKQSGSGLKLGKNFYINSEYGNRENEVHEFLHSIINPITEKIKLSADDEEKILKLCPDKLRDYQYALSILTEEIIRTYKTGFTDGNKPNFENFKKLLLSKDKHELEKALIEEKTRGESMALSVDELLNNDELIGKYYEKYSQDVLAERVWRLFEFYKSSGEDFEKYLLENYRDILK